MLELLVIMKTLLRKIVGESNYCKLRQAYFALRADPAVSLCHQQEVQTVLDDNFVTSNLILCNFCATVFQRTEPNHPEFLSCPTCGSIARERVVIQCILNELHNRTGELNLFFNQIREMKKYTLLECSPRINENKRKIFESSLGEYISSDFDMSAHQADVKIDLCNLDDIEQFKARFDFIICSHVLEHILDYSTALTNLKELLAPGGVLVLQVPILEEEYTKVTWDEFHGDNTRVYHRFGFDLIIPMREVFNKVVPVLGQIDFPITSSEISMDKYRTIKDLRAQCLVLGDDLLKYYGLGNPDLCDAFVAHKE